MPKVIHSTIADAIELDEALSSIEKIYKSSSTTESFLVSAADTLKALSNNKKFLKFFFVNALKKANAYQNEFSQYTPQVIPLSKLNHPYFLRANFWPSKSEENYRLSGPESFNYGSLHDHNFDFLTIGYDGSGYDSDIYSYDYKKIKGYVGEKIDIEYQGVVTLRRDSMLLYSKHEDLHSQKEPKDFSISLNIIVPNRLNHFLNQYEVCPSTKRIKKVINSCPTSTLIDIWKGVGDKEIQNKLYELCKNHPVARINMQVSDRGSST